MQNVWDGPRAVLVVWSDVGPVVDDDVPPLPSNQSNWSIPGLLV